MVQFHQPVVQEIRIRHRPAQSSERSSQPRCVCSSYGVPSSSGRGKIISHLKTLFLAKKIILIYLNQNTLQVLKESKLIQDEIKCLLNEQVYRNSESAKPQISKRCKDLAAFMESLMDEITKPDNGKFEDSQVENASFSVSLFLFSTFLKKIKLSDFFALEIN